MWFVRYRRVRTKLSGCPLITLCGGSFSQEKPRGLVPAIIMLVQLVAISVLISYSRAKIIVRSQDRFEMCLIIVKSKIRRNFSKARSLYSINEANSSVGFSWEKLPPQRVMRGHPERCVSTCKLIKIGKFPRSGNSPFISPKANYHSREARLSLCPKGRL